MPRFDLREVGPGFPMRLHLIGLDITLMLVEHGPWPVLALRVGDFAYVTDVKRIPPETESCLHGLKILILDAVRIRPHPNHFHFDEAVEWAHRLGAKQTYFTHLSHDYDHDETNRSLPPSIALGYDGLTLDISD